MLSNAPSVYACKCLNVKLRCTPNAQEEPLSPPSTTSHPQPPSRSPSSGSFLPVHIAQDSDISYAYPHLTLRSRIRDTSFADPTRSARYTSLSCLACGVLVYRIHQLVDVDNEYDIREGPIITKGWAETEVLRSASGWIEVNIDGDVLAGEEPIHSRKTESRFSELFGIVLPALSSSTPATPTVETQSQTPAQQQIDSIPRYHFPPDAVPPIFPEAKSISISAPSSASAIAGTPASPLPSSSLNQSTPTPLPFTPTPSPSRPRTLFATLSAIATRRSSNIREDAEAYIDQVVRQKIEDIFREESDLKREVQIILGAWHEGMRKAEAERAELEQQQQATTGRRNGVPSPPVSPGTPRFMGTPSSVVRNFLPMRIAPASNNSTSTSAASSRFPSAAVTNSNATSAAISASIPRISALSASLASAGFHHPRAQAQASDSSSGSGSTSTSRPASGAGFAPTTSSFGAGPASPSLSPRIASPSPAPAVLSLPSGSTVSDRSDTPNSLEISTTQSEHSLKSASSATLISPRPSSTADRGTLTNGRARGSPSTTGNGSLSGSGGGHAFQFRRSVNEDVDTAASYRYFLIEDEMEKGRRRQQREAGRESRREPDSQRKETKVGQEASVSTSGNTNGSGSAVQAPPNKTKEKAKAPHTPGRAAPATPSTAPSTLPAATAPTTSSNPPSIPPSPLSPSGKSKGKRKVTFEVDVRSDVRAEVSASKNVGRGASSPFRDGAGVSSSTGKGAGDADGSGEELDNDMMFDLEDEPSESDADSDLESHEHAGSRQQLQREGSDTAILPLIEHPHPPTRIRREHSGADGKGARTGGIYGSLPASLASVHPLLANALSSPSSSTPSTPYDERKREYTAGSPSSREQYRNTVVRKQRRTSASGNAAAKPKEHTNNISIPTSSKPHAAELDDQRTTHILDILAASLPSHRAAWKNVQGDREKVYDTFVKGGRDGDGVDEDGWGEQGSDLEGDEQNEMTHSLADRGIPGSMPISMHRPAPTSKAKTKTEPLSLASYQPKAAGVLASVNEGSSDTHELHDGEDTDDSDRDNEALSPSSSTQKQKQKSSAAAIRRAAYAERDVERGIDPGALDFVGDSNDDADSQDGDVDGDENTQSSTPSNQTEGTPVSRPTLNGRSSSSSVTGKGPGSAGRHRAQRILETQARSRVPDDGHAYSMI